MIRFSSLLLILTILSSSVDSAEPRAATEITPGNIVVLKLRDSSRWILMPHDGSRYYLYVATVDDDGELTIASHELPIDHDPDDPDPPDESLSDLVSAWADAVDDPRNRERLAAAYQSTTALIDNGTIETVDQLLQLQTLANTTVLGGAVDDWRPFFAKLSDYLDANTPADLAGYRAAWLQISEGLK